MAVTAAARLRRPPTARYDDIWDIGLVVQYWLAHPPHPDDDFALVRVRALTLLLAASFQRSSDVARIVDDTWRLAAYDDDGTARQAACFRVRGPKDHRNRVGALTEPHWLPLLPPEHPLYAACAVRAILAYRERASLRRCLLSGESTFLSEKRKTTGGVMHYFPLTAKRLSSLAKTFLHTAIGVDERFSGGSFRHSAASGALRGGVAVDDILAKGRWKSFSTYRDWYQRAAALARNPAAAAPAAPPLPAFVPLRRDPPHPRPVVPPPARRRGRPPAARGGV